MKKVMISLLCVVSILLSCAYALNQKVSDNNNMIIFDNNESSIPLHITSSNIDKEDLLVGFQKLKDQYHISIIRTDYSFENNEQLIKKSGVFSDDYFEKSNIDLYSGEYPIKENEMIASFETGNDQQVGMIRDLFGDQKMIVQSLEYEFSSSGITVNGEYRIVFEDISDHEIINSVKGEISNLTGLDQAELFEGDSGSRTSAGTAYLITLILIVAVVAIFSLTNVFYPITKLKEIGVMKLLGYSNHRIWTELNASVVVIPVIFTAITIIVQAFMIHHINIAYLLNLCIFQLIITLVSIAISLIMLIIIKRLKVSQILKKFFNFKISLYSSYILKFLVFVGLVFAIPYMVMEVNRYIDERSMKASYEEQADYLTLANFDFIGNEINGYMGSGEDILGSKLIDMFKELENTANAQYVSTMTIKPNTKENKGFYAELGTFNEDEYVFSIVNKNYLNRVGYQFEKPIDKYFSNDLTILIPMRYKSESIEQLVKNQAVSIYFTEYVENQDQWSQLPISIQYYQENNKKIFSERLDRASIDHGMISDPIFICQSTEYLTTKNSLITNSAISNPVRILDTDENRDAISKAIINHSLDNNNLEFSNMLNSGFAEQVSISQTSTLVWFGIITLALLVSVLASYYISLIILVSKRQMILVSRLLGHSFFARYENEIFYFVSIYIFCFLELLMLSSGFVSILFFIILVMIDVLTVYCLVKKNDTKSLSTALKGEE